MRGAALGAAAVAAVMLLACGSGATKAPDVEPVVEVASTPAATPQETPAPQTTPDVPMPGPEPSASPTPTPPYRNTVRWSTASEVENFGYDVYRGTAKDGPFERLTTDPVPGAGTSDETHKYSFVDENIDPYATYFYYVESISLGGVREKFTPVIEAKPKLPRPPSR
jgi:hypothetical protein